MFAVIEVLGVIFGLQVDKLNKHNNLLFNLLFPFMNVIYGSKLTFRYDKIHGLLKY